MKWQRSKYENIQTLSVLAGKDDKAVGILGFTVTYTRPRGAEVDRPVDDSLSSKLEPAVADILTKYFG